MGVCTIMSIRIGLQSEVNLTECVAQQMTPCHPVSMNVWHERFTKMFKMLFLMMKCYITRQSGTCGAGGQLIGCQAHRRRL